MRITCPNCTAHFEVPPEVLGKKGRSLKCASCSHSWYQTAQVETLDIADIMGQEYAERAGAEMGAGSRNRLAFDSALSKNERDFGGPAGQNPTAIAAAPAGAQSIMRGGGGAAGPGQGQSIMPGTQWSSSAPGQPRTMAQGPAAGAGAMRQPAQNMGAQGGPALGQQYAQPQRPGAAGGPGMPVAAGPLGLPGSMMGQAGAPAPGDVTVSWRQEAQGQPGMPLGSAPGMAGGGGPGMANRMGQAGGPMGPGGPTRMGVQSPVRAIGGPSGLARPSGPAGMGAQSMTGPMAPGGPSAVALSGSLMGQAGAKAVGDVSVSWNNDQAVIPAQVGQGGRSMLGAGMPAGPGGASQTQMGIIGAKAQGDVTVSWGKDEVIPQSAAGQSMMGAPSGPGQAAQSKRALDGGPGMAGQSMMDAPGGPGMAAQSRKSFEAGPGMPGASAMGAPGGPGMPVQSPKSAQGWPGQPGQSVAGAAGGPGQPTQSAMGAAGGPGQSVPGAAGGPGQPAQNAIGAAAGPGQVAPGAAGGPGQAAPSAEVASAGPGQHAAEVAAGGPGQPIAATKEAATKGAATKEAAAASAKSKAEAAKKQKAGAAAGLGAAKASDEAGEDKDLVDPDADRPDFGSAASGKASEDEDDFVDGEDEEADTPMAKQMFQRGQRQKSKPLNPAYLTAAVSVMAFVSLAAVLWVGRDLVERMWPAAKTFYERTGVVAPRAGDGLRWALSAKSLRRVDGIETLVVRGFVSNIDKVIKPVPKMKLQLLNEAKEVIQESEMPPPKTLLDPNESVEAELRLELPDMARATGGFRVTWAEQ